MEKKSNNNNRKRQLLLALFMLIVSSITLTTASYAWFTANTNVSVESLDVNVGASNGIQISTDAVNWRAAITKDELLNSAYTGNTNQIPSSMSPVSSAGNVNTGKLQMFSGAIVWKDDFDNGTPANTADDHGTYLLTAGALTDTAGIAGQYITFDIFLLVQQTETLYLTTGSEVTADGADTGLKNSARVAFLNEGNVASTNSTGALALSAATSAIIWEPNNNVHTAAAVDNNTAIYGTTISTTSTIASYPAVKAVIPAESDTLYPDGIPYSGSVAAFSDYLQTVTPTISTNATMAGYQTITTLSAGINKIRVYAWVEGQDIDCETNASGSDITFTLKFSKNSAA